MKQLILMIIASLFLITVTSASAENRKSRSDQNYSDSRYKLEQDYPSPERRYSRKELDQARRRAGNSLWMKQYGRKDPIYQSDQYRGRSSGNYRRSYRNNRYDRRW